MVVVYANVGDACRTSADLLVKLALSQHRQLDLKPKIEPHSLLTALGIESDPIDANAYLLTAPGIDNGPTDAHAYLFLADTKASPSLVCLKELLREHCASKQSQRFDPAKMRRFFYTGSLI